MRVRRSKLVDHLGRPLMRQSVPRPRSRYDSAQTVDENRRHWINADALSAKLANALHIRQKLRTRARYESANNSYCRGIVLTLANDLIGTGPRLQLTTPNIEVNREVESRFREWAATCGLAEKLRTMAQAKKVDGEAFLVLTTNPALASPVKLDLMPVECDRVTVPALSPQDWGNELDGIEYDAYGNPARYTVLDDHPGDGGTSGGFRRYPAWQVLHWFRCDRPGQLRGVPEITPALHLFAQLRRYTLAVLAAAETAADFAGVLQTDMAPDDGDAQLVEDWNTQEIEPRTLTALPPKYTLAQLEAEQPTTTYDGFVWTILREIARCLDIPVSKAAGDSSRNNYASGRLEFQSYFKSVDIEQTDAEVRMLGRVYAAWLEEAVLVPDYLSADVAVLQPAPSWMWDGTEHVDPLKEATAQQTRLASHTTTLADEYAKQGYDWRQKLEQRAAEVELMRQLGLVAAPVDTAGRDKVIDQQDAEESGAGEREDAA